LQVDNDNAALLEGPALPAFCQALHNCKSLRMLCLENVNLWADVAAAAQLIAALEGLPALQHLSVTGNRSNGTPATRRVVGECLARLIARSSSLRVLELIDNRLGEAGLAPIFQAFQGDAALEELDLFEEFSSADFALGVVLPAVRAATRLSKLEGLYLVDGEQLPHELHEVDDILEARRRADADAS